MKNRRYIVQIDFYIHAKSDNKAVKLAVWICRKLSLVFDNQARLTGVWSAPFGSLITNKIDDDRIKRAQE
jgi:hypothetical protein